MRNRGDIRFEALRAGGQCPQAILVFFSAGIPKPNGDGEGGLKEATDRR